MQGTGFGASKKPRVYVLYEKKPGKVKSAPLKVRNWSDTSIQATWRKKVPLDTYPIWVQPKGGQPGQFGGVTIVAPALDPGQVLAGAPKTPLMLSGTYFGTKQGKVLVEFVNPKGKTKRKRCKLQKKSWVMEPDTGVSSVGFFIPKLPPGTYDLFLAGKLGEVEAELTIN